MSHPSNITISIQDYISATRTNMRATADLAADQKDRDLQAKVSGINAAAVKKWLKAEVQDEGVENPKKITKLIEATVDQVVYGESLGHDLGMLQNNRINENHIVENNSSEAATVAPQSVSAIEADTNRAPDPLPSGVATGGTAESSPVVPPTHSNPVAAVAREASTAGQGGAETVTAPPEPIHVTDDDLDLPRSMNRANWIDGSPPQRLND